MEWGMLVDSTIVLGKLWCPKFDQVLDFDICKGVDHSLK